MKMWKINYNLKLIKMGYFMIKNAPQFQMKMEIKLNLQNMKFQI